jgi:hypothetical protein
VREREIERERASESKRESEGETESEREKEGGRVQGSEREEGERGRVYASGWLTEFVEPSGTLALRDTVIVFALQPGYGEAWFRV